MRPGVEFINDGRGQRTWIYFSPRWAQRRNIIPKLILDRCNPNAGPMLARYSLLRTPFGNLYLHHFLRSDNDRHFHDHPWSFLTFLLGSYIEHTPRGVFRRRRFSLLWRPATWRHWVEVVRPVWTLVFVTNKSREWGFWTERGWIDWRTYDREWCE
jgi:hypothetical protein